VKGLITSGGRGTRLRPITHTRNKHLIPIANKPILHYALENLAEADIREVGIIVPKGEGEVPQAIGDGSRWGLHITYISQEAPLGLAHCVLVSEEFIAGEPFVFYLGDNMVVGGVRHFIEKFEKERSNCLLTIAVVKDPERFGVPEIRDGKILRIEEKPAEPKSPYAVAGIYLYDRCIFEAVKAIRPSARGELEISDAHQYLIDAGYRVDYSEITGWWKDTGKPSDLLEANALVLSGIQTRIAGEVDAASALTGQVIVEKGAKLIASRIRGPAIIGSGSLIEHSYIGPSTSIYTDCHVRHSEIEYSLILANCSILDVGARIEESIIGNGSRVVSAEGKPRTHRLTTGDQCILQIA
jgi:glucose-1-phosphate thymidylyltransferase